MEEPGGARRTIHAPLPRATVTDMAKKSYTTHEWNEEGERLFGADRGEWRFVCPMCETVASIADYRGLHATPKQIGRQCIGTLLPEVRALGSKATGPCNYKADRDAPVRILDDGESEPAFDFAASIEVIRNN